MPEIVPKNLKLRKETAHALLFPAIVVLVGVGAFGLGRLTALEERRGHIIIHPPEMPAAVAQPVPYTPPTSAGSAVQSSGHFFVASKNGTKYYTANCGGASRIKSGNQVWFATAAEAEAAGYTLSTTCK